MISYYFVSHFLSFFWETFSGPDGNNSKLESSVRESLLIPLSPSFHFRSLLPSYSSCFPLFGPSSKRRGGEDKEEDKEEGEEGDDDEKEDE